MTPACQGGVDVLVENWPQSLDLLARPIGERRMGDVVAHEIESCDRGHEPSAGTGHKLGRRGVNKSAVLDGGDPGFDGVSDRFDAVGVSGAWYSRRRGFVDYGAKLFGRILTAGRIAGGRHHAAAGHDLYEARARFDLVSGRPAEIVDRLGLDSQEVAVPTKRCDVGEGRKDSGGGQVLGFDVL